MKVLYSEEFNRVYTGDPAAQRGRLEPSAQRLSGLYEIVPPAPASPEDVALVHGRAHVAAIRKRTKIWNMALLAAGATIDAARLAARGEPAFALCRPPGHHASPDDAWGFCFFNNVAIAVETLLREGAVSSALVLDIDLHLGDGTLAAFRGRPEVTYLHPEGARRRGWLETCRRELDDAPPRDVIAVSAGFDRHVDDWGELLKTRDYETIGTWVREASLRHASGRRFGVLEGGYAHDAMADAVEALLRGME